MHLSYKLRLLTILGVCSVAPGIAQASDCNTDVYFSSADISNSTPLTKPAAEFIDLRRRASHGDAAAQRSLAVGYETGYLVNPCISKAAYWYRKASLSGDKIAREWVDGQDRLVAMRLRPECIGPKCFGGSVDVGQMLALVAHRDNHFYAPVTVNGYTVNGIIDTGATSVSMSAQTARQMGISYSQGQKVTVSTANGSRPATVITVSSITVGSITLRDVEVSVADVDMPLLVGMSFLRRLDVDIRGNRMTLALR